MELWWRKNELLYCFNHLIYLLCLPCVSLATSMIVLIVATCSSSPGFHYTTYLCAPSPLIINPLWCCLQETKCLYRKGKIGLIKLSLLPVSRFQTFEAFYWTRIWEHNYRTWQRDQQPLARNTQEHMMRRLSPRANLGWKIEQEHFIPWTRGADTKRSNNCLSTKAKQIMIFNHKCCLWFLIRMQWCLKHFNGGNSIKHGLILNLYIHI